MSVQQQIAAQNIGVLVLGLGHLTVALELAVQRTHGLVVSGLGSVDLASLSRSGDDLGQVLHTVVFLQHRVEGIVGLVLDVLLAELLGVGIPDGHRGRDHSNHADQVQHQHHLRILQKNLGQTNGDFQRLFTIGVTKLSVVFFGSLICESLVSLGNLHEHLLSNFASNILIRVVFQGELAVSLLHLCDSSILRYTKNGVGIKCANFTILRHQIPQVQHAYPSKDQNS
mmetsp:Transcript_56224/g.98664  ORF Transcript_56224/g.98664 Transcript_56224/m.98664 type:complete len:227 (-) Transcript_56224:314-994(-)